MICEWERIINPQRFSVAAFAASKGNLPQVHWTPQSSGVLIPAEIAEELEHIWAAHIGASSLGSVFVDDEITAFEGEERIALIRHRKREQKLRDAKLNKRDKRIKAD